MCVCLGFLHRVPDPYRALKALTARSDLLLLEWKALKFSSHDEPFAYFSQKSISAEDFFGTEYWILSFSTVESMLRRLGFERFHRVDDSTQNRAILVAGKVGNPIFSSRDINVHRGRIRATLSHSKRYIKTLWKIWNGDINA